MDTKTQVDRWRDCRGMFVPLPSFILFVQPSICASGPCRIKRGWSWQIMRRWVLHLEVLTPRTDQLMHLWAGVQSLWSDRCLSVIIWNTSRSWRWRLKYGLGENGKELLTSCAASCLTGELSEAAESVCKEVGVYLHAGWSPGQVSVICCQGNVWNLKTHS